MNKKFLLTLVLFLSVQSFLFVSSCAVTTSVDVSEVMSWRVSSFSAADVTYPNTVYFILEFQNNGTVDMNVSGNLSIKKDGSVIYNNLVFVGNVSAQQYENFTFNWIPTTTGDFLANLTINMTNYALGQSNLTSTTASFTVYSPPPEPGGGPSGVYTPPAPNITRTWDVILPFVPVKIEIENKVLAFREIIIEVDKESHNVTVEVNRIYDKPGFVKDDPPGELYQYLEIKHENIEGFRSVLINFSVKNEWISDKQIDKSDVILNRYSANEEKWESFPANPVTEDSDYAYYKAEVPGLSVFSITAREKTACAQGERRCSDNDLQECSFGGLWETIETCEHECSGGECIGIPPACAQGERRCLGNTLQKCSADGSGWENIEICEYGCWDNECKEMLVSYVTQMAVFVMFAILVAIVMIMVALVYMNLKIYLARKR